MRNAKSRLKRPIHPMPAFVRRALSERGLLRPYKPRPPYQQNYYIGCIIWAVHEETKRKRLSQMLDELKCGDVYMNMGWRPSGKR